MTPFHGDIETRIKDITILIEKYPDSLNLHFQRGDLYLQHRQFEEALRDFNLSSGHSIDFKTLALKSSEALIGIGRY